MLDGRFALKTISQGEIMQDTIESILKDLFSVDFKKVSNELCVDMYNSLSNSLSANKNEVSIVTELCSVIDNRKYKKFSFHAKKIHGKASNVEFKNKNRVTVKELSDMAVISILTDNKKILFEKTAFIQNKKEIGQNKWDIEQDQLFLLRNFPTFIPKTGLLRRLKNNNVILINRTKSLGNYGLFQKPGEMIIVNAETIFTTQKNGNVVYNDLLSASQHTISSSNIFWLPYYDDFICDLFHYLYRFQLSICNKGIIPFIDTCPISLNIYDVIQNLVNFNIGEVASINSNIINSDLAEINNVLLNSIGLRFENSVISEDPEFESNIAVLVFQIDIGNME